MEVAARITKMVILSSILLFSITASGQRIRINGKNVKMNGKHVRHPALFPNYLPYTVDTLLYVSFENENPGEWTDAETDAFYEDSLNTAFLEETHTGTLDIVDIDWNGVTTRVLRIEQKAGELYHGYEVTIRIPNTYSNPPPTAKARIEFMFGEATCNGDHGKMPGFSGYGNIPVDDLDGAFPNEVDEVWAHRAAFFHHTGKVGSYAYERTPSPPAPGYSPYATEQAGSPYYYMTYGQPYSLNQYIHFNTFSGANGNDDGISEIFIDDQLIIQETGLNFRDTSVVSSGIYNYRLSGYQIKSFYGGDDGGPDTISDEPQRTAYTYIKNILIYKDSIHDSNWGSTHSLLEAYQYPDDLGDVDFYVDSTIDNATENLTSPGYPSDTPYHTNYRWLIDAGAGNQVLIEFDSGDETYGTRSLLLFYDGKTTDADLLFGEEGTNSSLSTTDFGGPYNGAIKSTGRYMYVFYSTGYEGWGNKSGGDFDADIVFE